MRVLSALQIMPCNPINYESHRLFTCPLRVYGSLRFLNARNVTHAPRERGSTSGDATVVQCEGGSTLSAVDIPPRPSCMQIDPLGKVSFMNSATQVT
jgi:hypothetical protein